MGRLSSYCKLRVLSSQKFTKFHVLGSLHVVIAISMNDQKVLEVLQYRSGC